MDLCHHGSASQPDHNQVDYVHSGKADVARISQWTFAIMAMPANLITIR